MLQGDSNALATAMQVIKYMLQGFIEKFVWAYLDNIGIYSDTLADYIAQIWTVCQCLQKHKIIALPKTYNLFVKRLNFLGHYINKKGVHTDTERIWCIQDCSISKSKKELQYLNGVIIYHILVPTS
jgi:hypothetical protein